MEVSPDRDELSLWPAKSPQVEVGDLLHTTLIPRQPRLSVSSSRERNASTARISFIRTEGNFPSTSRRRPAARLPRFTELRQFPRQSVAPWEHCRPQVKALRRPLS